MPAFTIGEDARVTVIGPYGNIPILQQTKISFNPNMSILKSQDLTGRTNTRTIMSATSGTITFNRTDNTMDVLASRMYQDWLAGNPIPQGAIYLVVNELDSSETDIHFAPCSFSIKDLGNYDSMRAVMQTLDWQCEVGGVIV